MSTLSRRQFLGAAGGTTLLAVAPLSRSLWAALGTGSSRPAPPLFTVLPYVQPGDASRLTAGEDRRVIAWQTQANEGDFAVEFGPTPRGGRHATVQRTSGVSGDAGRFFYSTHLDGLPLGRKLFYRVKCNGAPVVEGFFTTRQARGHNIRFVAFGDNSWGGGPDRAIAFQAFRQHPDFVMNTGDNVYDGGLVSEYERHFFPAYNAAQATKDTGAPLLRSVPFYSVLANHDVRYRSTANFDLSPDSLGYYQALHLPLNGPRPNYATPVVGDAARLHAFKQVTGERFPRMANYSFDWGDAHFCCLDANVYVDPTNKSLQTWIEHDLRETTARWKFVVYHHPAFNVGREHFREQHMRVLSPLLERCGVDMALHGHEHTYQRTRPFKFAPADLSRAHDINSGNRLVPGTFNLDRRFDGTKHTRAEGIIYITTGAGGARLYDLDWNNNPAKWRHPEDDNADYAVRFSSDRHSLSVFDMDGDRLLMRQIDEHGAEIDRVVVTKA